MLWIWALLGGFIGIIFGALAIPKIIVWREKRKLRNAVKKIKEQNLKFRVEGREIKFVEKNGELTIEKGPNPIIPKPKVEKKKVIKEKKHKKKGRKKNK